jgi:ribose transport system substrate-binding protein
MRTRVVICRRGRVFGNDRFARARARARARAGSARRITIYVLVALILAMLLGWYAGAFKTRPKIAIVTASSGPYWDQIVRGATDAANRYNLRLTIVRPRSDEPSQTEAIRGLLAKGFDGIAISPNDPAHQAAVLAAVGAQTNLVTYDSDCQVAGRLYFVGTANYDAGRNVGELIRHAVPDGGEVLITIGSLDKENGQRRRQGVIDELLERTIEPNRPMDPIDAPLKGPKYTIVATVVDGIDPSKAAALAADALKKHPNVKAMACLFAYSTPAALTALKETGQLGKVQVVGFDTNDETLAGIEAGHVYATMAQSPYQIGFEALRVLADAARGEKQNLPMFQSFYLACEPVNKSNLEVVRQDLAKKGAAAPSAPSAPATPPAAPAPGEAVTATTKPAA